MSTEEKKNSQISLDSEILSPSTEKEVSEIVREIYSKKLPIEITGTGTKKVFGYNLQTAKKLSLSQLSGIIDYQKEELYIKVKAGTPIEDIEKILEENNQELAFEPIDFGYMINGQSNKGTIGGYVACNFAGSRRFKVGSVRDHILGFKGVNGKGDIIKSGGTVVKNVTGYDLSKLISGSFGTLVVLTEITLKVSPKKQSQITVIVYSDEIKKISNLFDKILSSSNEVSAATFIPEEPNNKSYEHTKNKIFKFNDLDQEGSFLAFRIEGDKRSIDERLKELKIELDLSNFKSSILDVHQSVPFWKKVNNLELFSGTKNNVPIRGDGQDGLASVTFVNGKPISVQVTNGGSGYTFATLDLDSVVTGSGAVFSDIIQPPKGHGADIYTELGANKVLVYSRIENSDTTNPDFPVGNQFARIGILKNPNVN